MYTLASNPVEASFSFGAWAEQATLFGVVENSLLGHGWGHGPSCLVGFVEGVSDLQMMAVEAENGLAAGFDSGFKANYLRSQWNILQGTVDVPLVQLDIRSAEWLMIA